MTQPTLQEVIDALALANQLILKFSGAPYMRGERELKRIQIHGIAPPDGVDWKEMYRFQTAMRFLDNSKTMTRETAYKMADQDINGFIKATAQVKP